MSEVLNRLVFDAKVSERKILWVPISTIKPTPYNPKHRTKDGKELRTLVETIQKYGVVYPILITEDRDLIDGHRRFTAAKLAGLTEIECIVSSLDRDEAFGLVNTTPKRIARRDWLEIARGGGKALPAKEAAQYRELHALVGNYGVDLLIQRGLGLGILPLCKSVHQYGTKMRLEEIVMAAAQGRLTNRLNMEIRSSKSNAEKRKAIDELLAVVQVEAA
jgi:hypothetical protein